MTIEEDLRTWFDRAEDGRVEDWRDWSGFANAIAKAVRTVVPVPAGALWKFGAPHRHQLDLEVGWLRSGAVVTFGEVDPIEVYVRVTRHGDEDAAEEVEVDVHPIGKCRRCDGRVPLGPATTKRDEFAAVLVAGSPVDGHDCPAPR